MLSFSFLEAADTFGYANGQILRTIHTYDTYFTFYEVLFFCQMKQACLCLLSCPPAPPAPGPKKTTGTRFLIKLLSSKQTYMLLCRLRSYGGNFLCQWPMKLRNKIGMLAAQLSTSVVAWVFSLFLRFDAFSWLKTCGSDGVSTAGRAALHPCAGCVCVCVIGAMMVVFLASGRAPNVDNSAILVASFPPANRRT